MSTGGEGAATEAYRPRGSGINRSGPKPLSPRVKEALGQFFGAAKDEVLALSVRLGVSSEEVDELVARSKHNPVVPRFVPAAGLRGDPRRSGRGGPPAAGAQRREHRGSPLRTDARSWADDIINLMARGPSRRFLLGTRTRHARDASGRGGEPPTFEFYGSDEAVGMLWARGHGGTHS